MAKTIRKNATDFAAQVAAQSTTTAAYAAVAKTDNTGHQITKNSLQLYERVIWGAQGGGAVTDSNPQGDLVVLFRPDGTKVAMDVQQFLNSLV